MFAAAGAARVHAFDLSADAVAEARGRTAAYPNVTVEQSSGLDLPLGSESTDLFISLETIEHVDDDRGFVAEVARVLRPDGVFVCSTPNRIVSMPGKELTDRPWNRFHVREYSPAEYVALLGSYFEHVRLLGQNIRPEWRVKLATRAGRALPGNFAARINSALKLPRLVYDRENQHRVRELPEAGATEYLVAICSGPRQ
jgi:SAM-dependent methyltransferase